MAVEGPVLDPAEVPFSGSVRFTATLRNTGALPARPAVDYTVHHHRADGRQSAKTFKLTTRSLDPGQELRVEREHAFRPLTTRRHHPGPHAIPLLVNGVAGERAAFRLLPP
ncbi:hypothetical protein AB0910_02770 [Streptomyces sp. NPDC047002]|uniref:hypothetical protein n=1 Tax=Streptomyces sp. NPDC047002 TaxID=3155475 RepID=UPI003455505B